MTKEKVINLIQKYEDGNCSLEERSRLESWYTQHAREQPDLAFPEDFWSRKEAGLQAIFPDSGMKSRIVSLRRYSWSIAAAILVSISAGIWFFNTDSVTSISQNSLVHKGDDIVPGRNIATLTLSSGKVITLSDTKTGVVVTNYKLAYNDGTSVSEVSQLDNNLVASTPNGGTYQVTLPDGSTVSLNAASSIKFPASFAGLDKRTVELTGEAYFSVNKDAEHPFIVHSRGQEVKVLGTQFNINSYGDEATVKTTLVEGSLKIDALNASNEGVILKPNQQAVLTASSQINVKEVDVEAIVGWKNGDFVFNGEDFKSTMRKIARWYDVTVEYDSSAAADINLDLDGWVSRHSNLSVVLKQIESAGNVHFKVKGRTVIVTK
jgi:transmembrane sensor